MADIDNTELTTKITDAVEKFIAGFKQRPNGNREVSTAAFDAVMADNGVTKDEYKRVGDALKLARTAAAEIAISDLEKKLSEADASDRDSVDWRKQQRSMVRLPTYGGITEVEVLAERHSPNPQRGEGKPDFTVAHGPIRTKITTKSAIHTHIHDDARSRIRKAVGLKD